MWSVTRDTLVTDTLQRDSSFLDSLRRDSTLVDSLALQTLPEAEDTSLGGFDDEVIVPKILARDTMKVPDSLQYTDPFLFKYYIAIKDSLTHREVVDSLKAADDSLDWMRVDSLYLLDSAETAVRRFNEWYASLDKQARKRYDYDQKMAVKLHKMDSVMKVRDSLRAIKDSIRQNTPRILATPALPDSLLYKRIITWTHDPAFNTIEVHDLDTTYNYHFFDEPFYRKDVNTSYLGVVGTAAQTYDFMKREYGEGVGFYQPYEVYTYSPSTLPMYNTKTPYTELSYHGTLFANKEKEEDNIRIFTTQNILPSLNFALEYKRYGSGGMLLNEDTFNKTFVASANYLGERYLAHGGYIYNRIKHKENGGIVDNFWIRDTTVDTREISVNLLSAKNVTTKHTFFYDQSYRIPLTFLIRDSVKRARADSLGSRSTSTAFIGTSSELSTYRKVYTDEITDDAGRDYYRNVFYINPKDSYDSLRVVKLDNKAFIRLQPWTEDAVVSKIEGGVGDKMQSHYLFTPRSYLVTSENTVWNTFYTYAGAQGRIGQNIFWHGIGQLNLLGDEAGDFFIKADAGLDLYPFRRARKSPMSLRADFETSLRRPDFYDEHFYSNHFKWENDFDKVSTTRIRGSLDIPRWDLSLSAGYALLSGNIYYDSLGIARQNTHPMSVLSVSAKKNFVLLNFFHFDHRAVFQVSSKPEVVPLPAAALNFRYYIQFPVVKHVLDLQFGANAWYTTKWYAPGYNPVSGTFTVQQEEKYGGVPYIDLFLNAQWKRACLFVKIGNIGMGWPMDHADYFSAHHYLRPAQTFKIGIYWPFYMQSGKNDSISGKASSGMGGGSSTGGGGGLGGGLGGLSSGGRQTTRR